MAKSPISLDKTIVLVSSYPELSDDISVSHLDMIVEFESAKGTSKPGLRFNLRHFNYMNCDPKNPLASPSRYSQIQKIYKKIIQDKKDGFSDSTLEMRLICFKRYLYLSDQSKINPFSKEGYLSHHELLWEAVQKATERKKYLFNCKDGGDLGILEGSAMVIKRQLDSLLNVTDFHVSQFDMYLKQFKLGNSTLQGGVVPYLHDEWVTMLTRLNYYFTSLASQIIVYNDSNPNLPPPISLDNVVIDVVDGEEVTIKVIGTSNLAALPFNQMMLAGYLLFAYYTAFNATVITEIRHPISIINEEKLGRTSRKVKVKGYKGRSNSDVHALFETVNEDKHEKSENNEAGIIIAEVDKRDTNGIEDGVTFIEVLSAVSETYTQKSFGKIFYFVDEEGCINPFNYLDTNSLSRRLGLTSASSHDLKDFFINQFDQLLDNKTYLKIGKAKGSGYSKVVRKEYVYIGNPVQRIYGMAFGALSCITDVRLKGITMPLLYSEPDNDGNIEVSFYYKDGAAGKFIISEKYKLFLCKLEDWAYTRHAVKNPKVAPYLIPLGAKKSPRQWNIHDDILSAKYIRELGLTEKDYYLTLSAARIRATTSENEYSEDDMGFSARQILQHSIDTQMTKYLNGHPRENKRMLSQGIGLLVKISKGETRKNAIKSLKKELKVTVLSYEEYKKRNMPSNPNGVVCNAIPEVNGKSGTHYGVEKFANKQLKTNGDIPCFQYDLCHECKSAQLVDDAHAVYKLLSFIDALYDAIPLYPERSVQIEEKIEAFNNKLSALPEPTIEEAEDMLEENGRYHMFQTVDAVMPYL